MKPAIKKAEGAITTQEPASVASKNESSAIARVIKAFEANTSAVLKAEQRKAESAIAGSIDLLFSGLSAFRDQLLDAKIKELEAETDRILSGLK